MVICIRTHEVTLKVKFCLENLVPDIHGIITIEICVKPVSNRLKLYQAHTIFTYR